MSTSLPTMREHRMVSSQLATSDALRNVLDSLALCEETHGVVELGVRPQHDVPMFVASPDDAPAAVWVLTKRWAHARLLELLGESVSRDAFVARCSVWTAAHAAELCSIARGAPLLFLGDLDGCDLATLWTLHAALEAEDARLWYAGLDEAWLSAWHDDARVHGRALPTLRCSAAEAALAAWVTAHDPWVRGVLRGAPTRLLAEGLSLEIEGALGAQFFARETFALVREQLCTRRRVALAAS